MDFQDFTIMNMTEYEIKITMKDPIKIPKYSAINRLPEIDIRINISNKK